MSSSQSTIVVATVDTDVCLMTSFELGDGFIDGPENIIG